MVKSAEINKSKELVYISYFLFIIMICAIHLAVLDTYYLQMILVFSCLTKTQIYYNQFLIRN